MAPTNTNIKLNSNNINLSHISNNVIRELNQATFLTIRTLAGSALSR